MLYFKNTQETNLVSNMEIIIPETLSFRFTFVPLLSPNSPPFDLTLLLAVIGVILTTIRFCSQRFTVPIAMKPLCAVSLSLIPTSGAVDLASPSPPQPRLLSFLASVLTFL
jgi:hypothetical protein